MDGAEASRLYSAVSGKFEDLNSKWEAEKLLHDHYFACGDKTNVSFDGYEAQARIYINNIELEIESKHKMGDLILKWCPLSTITVESKPGTAGFRSVTTLEICTDFAESCDVEVSFEGCQPLQGALIRLKKQVKVRLEYYCRGNATRTVEIRNGEEHKSFDIAHVKKNWAPLKQDAYNTVAAGLVRMNPKGWLDDSLHWIGTIDLTKVWVVLTRLVGLAWYKYALGFLLLFVAYQSANRGNFLNVVICLSLFYVLSFTDMILAIKVDATVPLSGAIKFARSSVVWFWHYNHPPAYVVCDLVEDSIYMGLLFIFSLTTGFLFGLWFLQMIKGVHRLLTSLEYQDSAVYSNELRLPFVKFLVDRYFQADMRETDFKPDLYDSKVYLDRSFSYSDWFITLHNVYCSDPPTNVPWADALALIKCAKHSHPGVNSAPINKGYLSWEWVSGKLNVYLCKHIIEPHAEMTNVYSDVYVWTSRRALVHPPETRLSSDQNIACMAGKLYGPDELEIDPVGYSGSVLISGKGGYYVIHERESDSYKLVNAKATKTDGGVEIYVPCSRCMSIDASGVDADLMYYGESDAESETALEAGPSGQAAQAPPLIPVEADPRPRSRRRSNVERPNLVEEWKDYWGTKYNKQTYENHWNYVCTDSPVYASHVTNVGTRELYFDVSTTRQTINLACSSREWDCYYTHDGTTGRCMYQSDRQIFLIRRRDVLYFLNCRVIKSKNKLVSGQCVYHWVSGWSPYYSENVRIATVITFGRKIDEYYYYAIMNGSSEMAEFMPGRNPLSQVDYQRERSIAQGDFSISNYEIKEFAYNKMIRLLNANGQVVCSTLCSKSLDYDPTYFEYFNNDDNRLPRKFSPIVRSAPDNLSVEIRNSQGVRGWFRRIEDDLNSLLQSELSAPVVIPTMVLAETSFLGVNSIRVRLVEAVDLCVREALGDLCIRASSSSVLRIASLVNAYLWRKGCQIITYHGDVALLMLDNSISPAYMFGGAETVDTPCLAYVCPNDGIANQLKDWFLTEVPESVENIVGQNDISVHPDWGAGAAALRSRADSDRTLSSLEQWRNVQSVECEEVVIRRNQASATVDNPMEICGVMPGDYWLGEVCSALDSGCCFGDHKSLVSSYHVTYGNNVVLTRAGMTYTWKEVVYESKQEDLVMYNGLFQFAKAEKGEILCVVCPIRKIGQFLIVEAVGSNFAAREEAYFYELRPIDIVGVYNHIVTSNWRGIQGMSGSPIFNARGQIVSIYGLGKMESRPIGSSNLSSLSIPVTALTVLAPDCRADVIPDNFFRTAVADLLNNPLEEGNVYYLLEAPTGSGKTMSFTVNLLKAMGDNKTVTLLQPTVAAVKSAFQRICELLDIDLVGHSKYQVMFTVGQQHEDSVDIRGRGSRKLHIMTYGTSLHHVVQIEQSSNFVLLDEIHCRSDPTVVAGDLQFTKLANYKCVHLTATVLTRTRSQMLAAGLDISSTRFEIRETIKIETLSKDDKKDDNWLIIPTNVMGIRLEGFKRGFKIPMKVLTSGRVIFFLSTRHDCDSLYSYCCRHYGMESRQMLVIHGGTSFKLSEMQDDCWCFCTDVVGQAVTIPGCRVVVDFLEEMKPSTSLFCSKDGIVYEHSLVRRRIGEATSKQRKGRTGRTNVGFYVTPRGINPQTDHKIDPRTVAVAMLELEAERRFDFPRIEREHHNLELIASVRELLWLLPSNINGLTCYHRMMESISQNNKVYKASGKNFLSDSYLRKLEVAREANGDLVYLYLTPIISEEMMLHTMANKEKLARLADGNDSEWYDRMYDFCYKTKTEKDREEALLDAGARIYSYKEAVQISKDISFEVYNKIFTDGIVDDNFELEHSSVGAISGAAVALGATAILLGSAYHLTVKNIDRYVTKLYVFRNKFAASHCKFLTSGAKDRETLINNNFAKLAWQTAADRYEKSKQWFVSSGYPVTTEQHSGLPMFDTVFETAKNMLLNAWAFIPVTYHIGAFPSLVSIMSAGWIGKVFIRLESILGRTIAVTLLSILNGFCVYFAPMPLAITCCVAQVIGFVVNGLMSGEIKSYGMYGEVVKSSDRAWDLIFGMSAGVGVGYIIKNQLLVTAQFAASSGVLHQVGGTAMGVVGGRSYLFGATGNAAILVKQVYLLFTRIQDGRLTWDSVGAMLTGLIQAANIDITTGVLCALVSVALIAVRSGLKLMKYQAGVSVKTVRPADGTNTYVEDFFGSYDNFALTVLSSASVLASPSSLISILIAWIANCSRRGEVTRGCFKDAFDAYSGVPIAIAIISEGINALATRELGERHSVNVLSILFSIPSMLAGVVGCVYWFNNPDVIHTISNVWGNVKQFTEFLWSYLKECVGGVANFIGSSIGSGIMSKLVDSVPSWMRSKTDDLIMEEKFSMLRSEPQVVNDWFLKRVESGKVSLIERLHYSRSIFNQERYGSVLPVSFLRFVKDHNQGLSLCRKYVSRVPFEFFCITSNDLYKIINCFAGEVEVNLNAVLITRGDCKVTIELGYRTKVATHYISVNKGSMSMTFLVISRPSDTGGSINYVLGWRVPASITSILFNRLACLHPAVEALSGHFDQLTPDQLELETNDVCNWVSHAVKLTWQRAITSVIVGVVDKTASMLGLISKVKDNEFDLGLIPL